MEPQLRTTAWNKANKYHWCKTLQKCRTHGEDCAALYIESTENASMQNLSTQYSHIIGATFKLPETNARLYSNRIKFWNCYKGIMPLGLLLTSVPHATINILQRRVYFVVNHFTPQMKTSSQHSVNNKCCVEPLNHQSNLSLRKKIKRHPLRDDVIDTLLSQRRNGSQLYAARILGRWLTGTRRRCRISSGSSSRRQGRNTRTC